MNRATTRQEQEQADLKRFKVILAAFGANLVALTTIVCLDLQNPTAFWAAVSVGPQVMGSFFPGDFESRFTAALIYTLAATPCYCIFSALLQ